jgi:hypothetical protein
MIVENKRGKENATNRIEIKKKKHSMNATRQDLKAICALQVEFQLALVAR